MSLGENALACPGDDGDFYSSIRPLWAEELLWSLHNSFLPESRNTEPLAPDSRSGGVAAVVAMAGAGAFVSTIPAFAEPGSAPSPLPGNGNGVGSSLSAADLGSAVGLVALVSLSFALAAVAMTTLAWMLHAWRSPQHLEATGFADSSTMPPDWAQIHPDGRIDAMPGAAGRADERVHYGYDATRMPIRFAESCHPADVALAARLTPALDRSVGDPAVRDLDGTTLLNEESVVAAAESGRTRCRWPKCSRRLSVVERRPPPAGETDVLRCCLECAGAAHAEWGDLGWMPTSGWHNLRTSLSACATRHT